MMPDMVTRAFRIVAVGAFSLRESALFGFGQRAGAASWDGVMRLAFCLDGGFETQVGVELTQEANVVTGVVHGDGDLDLIRRHVARVLSLDHDARGFAAVGECDPVIGALQQVARGLRPPLFYSPYEAAVWSVLSARRPAAQMAQVRAALSEAHGAVFELAGEHLAALPTPTQLLAVDEFAWIDPTRLARMHAIARAAADGRLEADRLLRLGPEAAMADLQQLKGIGPFYAALIVIRGTGFTDVLPIDEPKSLGMVQRLYGLAAVPTQAEFERIAANWRPWRTWATVLIRAAGSRLDGTAGSRLDGTAGSRLDGTAGSRRELDQLSSRTAASPIAVSSSSTRLAASPIGT